MKDELEIIEELLLKVFPSFCVMLQKSGAIFGYDKDTERLILKVKGESERIDFEAFINVMPIVFDSFVKDNFNKVFKENGENIVLRKLIEDFADLKMELESEPKDTKLC